jgi:hypothetical protein
MKQYFSFLAALILCASASSLKAQIVNIPDANLKAELLTYTSINTNNDSEIQLSEAQNFVGVIDVSLLNITDLTGIEEFTSLLVLGCEGNQITSIDFSANTMALEELYCTNNPMTSLNLSGCTSLEELDCHNNQLSSLILPNTNTLLIIDCKDNQLTSLDASNNAGLEELYANNNLLTTINLTGCTTLFEVDCNNNLLDSLDISTCDPLHTLDCSSNAPLKALDFSMNDSLKNIDFSSCDLRSLDMKTPRYADIISFNALSNPNLRCIEVLDTAYATANWTDIDVTANFTQISCASIVYIPDTIFKAYLVNALSINKNGDTEIQLSEAFSFGGAIDVFNLGISDLTGIETFKNLDDLDIWNNQLTTLNLRGNRRLRILNCQSNQLSSLDLSKNTNLVGLVLTDNPISSIDLSKNIKLTQLYAGFTDLTSLDISKNVAIGLFKCQDAMLTSLNLKNGNNTSFSIPDFTIRNNPNLACIEVDDSTYSANNWAGGIDPAVRANLSNNCSFVGTAAISNQLPNLQVYPNPTQNNLNINLGNTYTTVNITISNALGQTIFNQSYSNLQQTEVELTGQTGFYFIQIETEKGNQTIKVLKQ